MDAERGMATGPLGPALRATGGSEEPLSMADSVWGGLTVGRRQRLFNKKKRGGGLLDSVTDRGVTSCTAGTETLISGTRTELTARPCSLHYVYT